jgi:hypothetical protein
MILTRDNYGIWYAIKRTANGVFMGYAPTIQDAITYCWQLAEENQCLATK